VRELLSNPESLVAVFQPIVSLADGSVVGYEALTRFEHPADRNPHEWFTLARLCGLGGQLQALAAARALAVPGRPSGAYLSLNFEPSTLVSAVLDDVLPADLSGILIEITEQELISDHVRLGDELSALRARGARIALDDTGAGYSGLRHVTLIRPDVIKLDRALVENLDADPAKLALVESFVNFARRTETQLCAEGVESDAELDVLAELGVDLGQGYRLARPGPPWPVIEPKVAGELRLRERRSPAPVAALAGRL
jgi:EAL domain-containing protein (putative c-di-GMP-specific phosphodiesterase class I)